MRCDSAAASGGPSDWFRLNPPTPRRHTPARLFVLRHHHRVPPPSHYLPDLIFTKITPRPIISCVFRYDSHVEFPSRCRPINPINQRSPYIHNITVPITRHHHHLHSLARSCFPRLFFHFASDGALRLDLPFPSLLSRMIPCAIVSIRDARFLSSGLRRLSPMMIP